MSLLLIHYSLTFNIFIMFLIVECACKVTQISSDFTIKQNGALSFIKIRHVVPQKLQFFFNVAGFSSYCLVVVRPSIFFDIKKNATGAVFKATKDDYRYCFRARKKRWDKCIAPQGADFKRV